MDTTTILQMFGVTIEQVGVVAAAVFVVMEFLKGTWPTFFNGSKTVIAAIIVGVAISAKLVYPDWGAMLALSIAAYILPAGVHKMFKRVAPNA